ncbi:MAG: nucleoside-diphosphate sugar epimerase/dehydratase [Cyclonatronaceae bacterium]
MSRQIPKYLIDLTLWGMALPLAYLLRIESMIARHADDILLVTLMVLPLKAVILYLLGFHLQSWRKTGIWDLFRIVQGVAVSTAAFFVIMVLAQDNVYVPRSVPVIEGGLALLMLSMVRLITRLGDESHRRRQVRWSDRDVKRVLVAGAGEAGTMLARELSRHPESHMEIVGFLDDNHTKQKQWFLGYRILGTLDDLGQVARTRKADKVIIAMPTAPGEVIRKVVTLAQEAGIESQIMPGLYELLSGNFNITQLRNVDVADLLRRKQVQLELGPISEYLYKRTVLVTGAGGSIGSEIVRQMAGFHPAHVLLLGRGENSIYQVEREFRSEHPEIEYTPIIADVRDRDTLEHVFRRFRPHVVFHAAAHKHVPLMEANPDQAVLNNIGGTRNLAELALEHDVERLVNVSTDKAVNPTSVMGSSKRVAEYVVQQAALRARPDQAFVSVRFGNVLGSRGSVVPLFRKQIEEGGPVTVTHPDMTRYFMTIPEASQLVLQAGGLSGNGSVYVLDMGQPVRIVDLARDLIRLCGLTPEEDIQIQFTGSRPGEKLFEELLTAEEGTSATRHAKIFAARSNGLPVERFGALLDALFDAARRQDEEGMRNILCDMIPSCTCADACKKEADPAGKSGSASASGSTT